MPKGSSKKPARKGAKKKGDRGVGFFCLFFFVVATLAGGAYFMLLFPGKSGEITPPQLSEQAKKKPLPQAQPVVPPHKKTAKKPRSDKPLVAIVIDDMGNRQNTGRAAIALDLPLSFAFLPGTPFSAELQKQARAKGSDILLHLPLEPMDPKWNGSPGTLTTAMSPETMRTLFNEDLQTVPNAIGINNHMGSRFTSNPEAMRTLLALVRNRNLFFLDSVTAPQSVATDLAREMGVKTERRTVFLDNDQNPDKIRAQLELLVKLAGEHGQAVGIGHPYPATVEALRRYQTQLRSRTEMVGIHRLVR
ncbi:divergent polysaccharide deacetylase family protein [Thiovibrio frasassiensis]|uniref:Divergent polysaccharide deacetylase family protein n=1 Tax=Thiovibrio frasassiensis TaxID=2984131 RepID=A0A9X4RLZ9_9BACT|nr:divergent polysaccharide deacetylase family protein [Thiovibrio frasassiensis]MDG4475865.1 divergent polysaccharide deacetylase family protein [Thiovibrio frasassiensis]